MRILAEEMTPGEMWSLFGEKSGLTHQCFLRF